MTKNAFFVIFSVFWSFFAIYMISCQYIDILVYSLLSGKNEITMTSPALLYEDEVSDIAQIIENEPIDIPYADQFRVQTPGMQYIVSVFPSVINVPGDEKAPVSKYLSEDLPSSIEHLTKKAGLTLSAFGKLLYAALAPEEKKDYEMLRNKAYLPEEHALFTLDAVITELVANAAEHGNHHDPDKKVKVEMSLLDRPDGCLQFNLEVSDEGGYHDFQKHKEKEYVTPVVSVDDLLSGIDIAARGHGDAIVRKIRWTEGLVLNNRSEEPSMSSVLYSLVLRPSREALRPS